LTKRTASLTRFGPSLAVALLGFAIVAAATLPHPGPRVSRSARLIDLIAAEDGRTRSLKNELDKLQAQLSRLQKRAAEVGLAEVQQKIDQLGLYAGLADVSGPGVVVEMRDSPLRRSPTGDPNDLVIHQQDIQGVVNALWAGGAEAISINGERLTSDSAVRCVGNTLLLHGSVYAPPYRISAIGDQVKLFAVLASDPLVDRFRIFVEDFHLGFTIQRSGKLTIPTFHGVVSDSSARVST
jgi:uncharacterized protein YlxW (UPF0749 family)